MQASPVEKRWVSLFHRLPSHEMEALAWVWHAETIATLTALDLIHEIVASHEERQAKKISDCLPPSTDDSVPRVLLLRERFAIVSIPSCTPPKIFLRGKQIIKQIAHQVFPKELILFAKEHGKVQT